ncbi:MAG: hypothetical protein M1467_03845 [Deltaproteobacteria bacterium]|nr:hypothetical protein [Deltaproteobacteria bacterium]
MNYPKLPIETVKMALKLYEHWIPAYAGMTLRGFNFSSNGCHSRVGGNPEK